MKEALQQSGGGTEQMTILILRYLGLALLLAAWILGCNILRKTLSR